MFIDSHCHIDFPELAARMPEIREKMAANKVTHALCVSVDLPDFPRVLALGPEAEIVAPAACRRNMAKMIRDMAARYED